MNMILISGSIPQDHAENMTSQIHDLLNDRENVGLITYTDEETHVTIKQYAQGENLPILRSIDTNPRKNAQLSAMNKETGELDPLSDAPLLIIINPTGYQHRIRKHRESIRRNTAVIFTQPDQAGVKSPGRMLSTTRKAKQTGLNQRRPQR